MSSRREAEIAIHRNDLVIAGPEEAIRRHANTILRLRDEIIDVLNGVSGRLSFDDWCNPPEMLDEGFYAAFAG